MIGLLMIIGVLWAGYVLAGGVGLLLAIIVVILACRS